jgi:hypothetical protein
MASAISFAVCSPNQALHRLAAQRRQLPILELRRAAIGELIRSPMRIIPSLVLVGWLCGCTHERFTRGSGDAGSFILARAVAYGSTPLSTNDLPAVSEAWRYSEDSQGVVIRMPRDRYAALEQFLQQAFGPPRFGPVDTTDGAKLGGYRLTSRGGGIQFSYDDKDTQVIILRAQERKETP